MIWHKFDKCGVYHYADKNDQGSSAYIGTVAVKPKHEHKILEYVSDKKNFNTGLYKSGVKIEKKLLKYTKFKDLITIENGDTVWWKWKLPAMIYIKLVDGDFLNNEELKSEKCRKLGGFIRTNVLN